MSDQLSPHFTLAEFTRSETAARLGVDMRPPAIVVDNLRALCLHVLEPIRAAVGPVFVSSGWRPVRLNVQIGGSRTSDHITGLAADIKVFGFSPLQLSRTISAMSIPFKQLICEFGQWVHVSYDPLMGQDPKREVLTALKRDGRTVYEAGLVEV